MELIDGATIDAYLKRKGLFDLAEAFFSSFISFKA
jgi:hypothetical protein